MTFPIDTNIPQANNDPADDQPKILANFGNINSVITVDHVEPGSSTNNGKHKFCRFPNQVAAPVTIADECGLFGKNGAFPTEPALFFKSQNNMKEYQLTTPNQTNSAQFGVNTDYGAGVFSGGWTFLPGGLVYQWGVRKTESTAATYLCQYQFVFQTILTQGFDVLKTGAAADGNKLFTIDTTSLPSTTGFTVRQSANNNGSFRFSFWGIGIGFAP